jgi:hypothetical protein
VNPSLTITALAEQTLSKVRPKTDRPPIEPVQMTWEVPRPQTSVVPGTPEAAGVEGATDGKTAASPVLAPE